MSLMHLPDADGRGVSYVAASEYGVPDTSDRRRLDRCRGRR